MFVCCGFSIALCGVNTLAFLLVAWLLSDGGYFSCSWIDYGKFFSYTLEGLTAAGAKKAKNGTVWVKVLLGLAEV